MTLLWTSLPGSRLLADVSLWSANLAEPGAEVKKMEPYADLFHLDVSDAHFVSGLLFFPDLVAALRPLTQIPFHVHLMTEHPSELVDAFADAGVDMITVHHENGPEAVKALEKIHQRGLAAGLALGQDIAPEGIIEYLEHIQLVLLMGTRLGVKGQSLNPATYARIQTTRNILQEHGYADKIKVGVDGGIREQTVPLLRAAGADLIVPGSLVFQSSDLAQTLNWLHTLPTE
jgi:ribulose-phosphate 3-epimerase